jgi:hypothetical protein
LIFLFQPLADDDSYLASSQARRSRLKAPPQPLLHPPRGGGSVLELPPLIPLEALQLLPHLALLPLLVTSRLLLLLLLLLRLSSLPSPKSRNWSGNQWHQKSRPCSLLRNLDSILRMRFRAWRLCLPLRFLTIASSREPTTVGPVIC